MPFFKELRRRKTASKAEKSIPNGIKNSNESNGTSDSTMPTTKSSSTLNSVYGSSTPSSSIQPHQSTPNLVMSKSASTMTPNPLPQRPMPLGSVGNRSSFMVGTTQHSYQLKGDASADYHLEQGSNTPSVNGTATPKLPTSTFAPRIMTISDNSWVCSY